MLFDTQINQIDKEIRDIVQAVYIFLYIINKEYDTRLIQKINEGRKILIRKNYIFNGIAQSIVWTQIIRKWWTIQIIIRFKYLIKKYIRGN